MVEMRFNFQPIQTVQGKDVFSMSFHLIFAGWDRSSLYFSLCVAGKRKKLTKQNILFKNTDGACHSHPHEPKPASESYLSICINRNMFNKGYSEKIHLKRFKTVHTASTWGQCRPGCVLCSWSLNYCKRKIVIVVIIINCIYRSEFKARRRYK